MPGCTGTQPLMCMPSPSRSAAVGSGISSSANTYPAPRACGPATPASRHLHLGSVPTRRDHGARYRHRVTSGTWRRPMAVAANAGEDAPSRHSAGALLRPVLRRRGRAGHGPMHHALVEGTRETGILNYALVFFAIWWAWMNYTWFASAYDNDDVLLPALLVRADRRRAGPRGRSVARVRRHGTSTCVLGYLVMRVALVSLWLRAAATTRPPRRTGLRYASGVRSCMVGWMGRGPARSYGRLGVPGDGDGRALVPTWAERQSGPSWHPHHISERYGLFTLIVLGEAVAVVVAATWGSTNGRRPRRCT